MTNHIKKKVTGMPFTVSEEVLEIQTQAFIPLTDVFLANKNFYNIKQLIAKGHAIPQFRFDALEEEFVKKNTRMCEIFRDYGPLGAAPGSLTHPFNIRQMLTVLKISEWKECHPFSFYLTPLEEAISAVVQELLDMQKAGLLRSKYIVPANTELLEKYITMTKCDVTAQILMCNKLR